MRTHKHCQTYRVRIRMRAVSVLTGRLDRRHWPKSGREIMRNTATVRYESGLSNFITNPFEIGLRHLKVACSDGSQNTLLQLAKERIIYRPLEADNTYKPLTIGQRIYHGVVGTLETVGYLTLVIPFIVSVAEKIFNKPWYPKGSYPFRTHMEEGGDFDASQSSWRKNPFDANGAQDPFYQGASWLPTDRRAFA